MKPWKSFSVGFFLLSICGPNSSAQSATVDWNHVDQEIDGFGATDASQSPPMTSAQADLLFSRTTGVGLSLMRTVVPDDGSCSTVNATCAGKARDMQLAVGYGARVWGTPWSPPASMKSNGSIEHGGSLLADSYGAYASYLANYVKSLKSLYGVNLYALSVQNEPEISASYDSSIWSAANFHDFIGNNLGPKFTADGLATLIVMPETTQWQDLAAYEKVLLNDPAAAAYVTINATHDYKHVGAPTYPLGGRKRLWETEVCDLSTFDPSMTSALKYAQYINDWMVIANANAWHYWWLIDLNDGDNEGLISRSGTVTKRLYMMGNYSKFVLPGFYRIDATETPQSGVSVSAYGNLTTGALVIVVINQNSFSISQSFALNGITPTSVTPWITSSRFNLEQQLDVAVSKGSFSYSLPGASVISFVATNSLAPPSHLTAAVK
jgi:glucuronoarabinoxylan endo-1,4-beta-xylanase